MVKGIHKFVYDEMGLRKEACNHQGNWYLLDPICELANNLLGMATSVVALGALLGVTLFALVCTVAALLLVCYCCHKKCYCLRMNISTWIRSTL